MTDAAKIVKDITGLDRHMAECVVDALTDPKLGLDRYVRVSDVVNAVHDDGMIFMASYISKKYKEGSNAT